MGWIGGLVGFLGVSLVNGGADRGFRGVLWGVTEVFFGGF